mgnify:CR=1 FL=1
MAADAVYWREAYFYDTERMLTLLCGIRRALRADLPTAASPLERLVHYDLFEIQLMREIWRMLKPPRAGERDKLATTAANGDLS